MPIAPSTVQTWCSSLVTGSGASQVQAADAIAAIGRAAIDGVLRHVNFSGSLSTDFGHVSDGVLALWCAHDPRALAATAVKVHHCSLIGDHGLACVARLPRLAQLELVEGQTAISDHGLRALAAQARGLESLVLWNCHHVTDEGLRALQALPKLAHLTLTNYRRLSDATLALLATFPVLRRVGLAGKQTLSEPALIALARDRQLTGLELSCCPAATASLLAGIARVCPGLSHLRLGSRNIDVAPGLQAVASHGQLLQLTLYGEEGITDATLAALSRCRQLHEITLWNADLVTPAGWQWLSETSELTECKLGGRAFDDAAAQALAHHRSLRRVTVSSPALGSPGVAVLARLPDLQQLKIMGSDGIAAEALAPLAAHPHLRRISLDGCADSGDQAFAVAATIRVLWELDLPFAQPTGVGIRSIARLPQLGSLNCDASRLRGDDLQPLRLCRSLVVLTLWHAQGLNDDSFAFLDDLPTLTSLLVTDAGQLTDRMLDRLERMESLRAIGLIGSTRLSRDRLRAFVARKNLMPIPSSGIESYPRFMVCEGQFMHSLANGV